MRPFCESEMAFFIKGYFSYLSQHTLAMTRLFYAVTLISFLLFNTALFAQGDLPLEERKQIEKDTKKFSIVALDGSRSWVQIIPDYANHVLKMMCKTDVITIKDFWGVPPETRLLNRNFIEIRYAVRGGSNLSLDKLIILCVDNGKLFEAAHIYNYLNSETRDYKSNYRVKLGLTGHDKNNYQLVVQVHESVYSAQNPEENYNYNNPCTLSFDVRKNVFYSIKQGIYDHLVMNTPKANNKQPVNGIYPLIMLGRENYHYINRRWVQFESGKNGYEF